MKQTPDVTMTFVDLILICLSSVMLGDFYQDCLDDGMIFGKFGLWLELKGDKWWSSPLGGCQICNTTWTFFLMFPLFIFTPMVWMVLTGMGMSNFILKILFKLDL